MAHVDHPKGLTGTVIGEEGDNLFSVGRLQLVSGVPREGAPASSGDVHAVIWQVGMKVQHHGPGDVGVITRIEPYGNIYKVWAFWEVDQKEMYFVPGRDGEFTPVFLEMFSL